MIYIKSYGKLVYLYDLGKHELIEKEKISVDNLLNNPNYVLCFKIEDYEDFKYNDLNIEFNDFPWKCYYKLNREFMSINSKNNTKNNAWHHWTNYGKKEERAFSFINNTNVHRARFGNLFFLNMCLHMFSQKYDLKCSYKNETEFNKLGIYFNKGTKIYKKNILLTDYNFENILESDISPRNVIINNSVWFHTNRFCKMIKEYFEKNNIFSTIMKHNIYRRRYGKNNDLFIHVRLGDVSDKTKHLEDYYINTINVLKFDRGYITSDNINHDICQSLIRKYNLTVYNNTEVDTIMFGSTCKHIILSGGTFSWLLGFLGFSTSNIFYPELKDKWYGDIFSFSNWNKIKI